MALLARVRNAASIRRRTPESPHSGLAVFMRFVRDQGLMSSRMM